MVLLIKPESRHLSSLVNRMKTAHAESRHSWSQPSRRLGIASSTVITVVGVMYLAVIVIWLAVEGTPLEPIGDPYLAAMEILTILSAISIVGFAVSIWFFVDSSRRPYALLAMASGALGAGLTITVHFVQLTAIRQMWTAGDLTDYRLVWPSRLFAVEYLAWDVLMGLTFVLIAIALHRDRRTAVSRRTLMLSGFLCLLGVIGPLSGWMVLQWISVIGYGIVLPVAAALTTRMFLLSGPQYVVADSSSVHDTSEPGG